MHSKAEEPAADVPDLVRLSRILKSFAVNQIIASAVRLDIPSLVRAKDRTPGELAELTGIPWARLSAVMAALVDLGIVERNGDASYASTPLAGLLSRDGGGLYGQALLCGDMYYRTWARLDHSLRTGESAFAEEFGTSMWQYLDEHPEEAGWFSRTMGASSHSVADALMDRCRFPETGLVVDVGAGDGTFLTAVLERHPGLRGLGVERAGQTGRLAAVIDEHDLRERCTVVPGDMFQGVPPHGSVYVFKGVLHNWSDTDLEPMLKRLRSQTAPGTRLLVIEHPLPQPADMTVYGAVNALMMTLLFGSSDRTADGYRLLLQRCGFQAEVRPSPDGAPDIIEGVST